MGGLFWGEGGHWGYGGEDPGARKFCIFCKSNLILGLFRLKIKLFKRGTEIGRANIIKLVAQIGYVGGG